MADITSTWSQDRLEADWTITPDGDLATGSDLETAVIVSLFTDRIDPDWPAADKRGWWGDSFLPSPIGSRLWELVRAKKVDGTSMIARVNDICREALQWMIDEGIAESVTVSSSWISQTGMNIVISMQEPAQSAKTTFSYAWAWTGLRGV